MVRYERGVYGHIFIPVIISRSGQRQMVVFGEKIGNERAVAQESGLILNRFSIEEDIDILGIGANIDAANFTDVKTRKIHPPTLSEEDDAGSEDQEGRGKDIKKSLAAILGHENIVGLSGRFSKVLRDR